MQSMLYLLSRLVNGNFHLTFSVDAEYALLIIKTSKRSRTNKAFRFINIFTSSFLCMCWRMWNDIITATVGYKWLPCPWPYFWNNSPISMSYKRGIYIAHNNNKLWNKLFLKNVEYGARHYLCIFPCLNSKKIYIFAFFIWTIVMC